MILNSFIHFTDTERNITLNESCYKNYSVRRCSGKIGITTCTTNTVTKNLRDFPQSM